MWFASGTPTLLHDCRLISDKALAVTKTPTAPFGHRIPLYVADYSNYLRYGRSRFDLIDIAHGVTGGVTAELRLEETHLIVQRYLLRPGESDPDR